MVQQGARLSEKEEECKEERERVGAGVAGAVVVQRMMVVGGASSVEWGSGVVVLWWCWGCEIVLHVGLFSFLLIFCFLLKI